MNKYSLSALVAAGLLAGGMTAGSASAADLGGNCCADLEERIAELEATTARKGNRKVSLTVSGFVAQQILAWDDGDESNVYITDTGSISIGSHFKFTGQATIAPGWTAGYVLKVETMNNDSLGVTQFTDEGGNAFAAGGSSLGVESSYWFVKSESLGRLSLGQQSGAADNQAILPDGSGTLVVANYVLYDVNGFKLNRGAPLIANGVAYGDLAACQTFGDSVGASADCEGDPNNNVRYDTPVFLGFSGSASWGEDDVWGASLRYSGEFSGFKLAVAGAYTHRTDDNALANARANGGLDASSFQVGAYLENIPTGLFLYGAYGKDMNDVTNSARLNGRGNPDGDNFYVKAGLRTRFSALGHTIFYGEYGENDDKMSAELFDAGVNSSELQQYGLGVVQEVDAAAMSLWLAWRHYEADDIVCNAGGAITCGSVGLAVGNNSFEDFDIIKAGALINF